MLKNLANCTPREFLKQTNKIRKAVQKWIKATDIINFRGVSLPEVPEGMSEAERATFKQNALLKRFNSLCDIVLEQHPDETLEVLALCCFVEPEDVDKHEVAEYLESLGMLLNSEAVVGFFYSLGRLGNKPTQKQ